MPTLLPARKTGTCPRSGDVTRQKPRADNRSSPAMALTTFLEQVWSSRLRQGALRCASGLRLHHPYLRSTVAQVTPYRRRRCAGGGAGGQRQQFPVVSATWCGPSRAVGPRRATGRAPETDPPTCPLERSPKKPSAAPMSSGWCPRRCPTPQTGFTCPRKLERAPDDLPNDLDVDTTDDHQVVAVPRPGGHAGQITIYGWS